MKREEFIFTVGFQGNTAIIDEGARRSFSRMSTMELAERGMYRAAFCSAVYSEDESDMSEFVKYFSTLTGESFTADRLKRLFGVHEIPAGITRFKVL